MYKSAPYDGERERERARVDASSRQSLPRSALHVPRGSSLHSRASRSRTRSDFATEYMCMPIHMRMSHVVASRSRVVDGRGAAARDMTHEKLSSCAPVFAVCRMRAMLDADAGTAPYSVHLAPIVKPGLTIMHPRVRRARSHSSCSASQSMRKSPKAAAQQ